MDKSLPDHKGSFSAKVTVEESFFLINQSELNLFYHLDASGWLQSAPTKKQLTKEEWIEAWGGVARQVNNTEQTEIMHVINSHYL